MLKYKEQYNSKIFKNKNFKLCSIYIYWVKFNNNSPVRYSYWFISEFLSFLFGFSFQGGGAESSRNNWFFLEGRYRIGYIKIITWNILKSKLNWCRFESILKYAYVYTTLNSISLRKLIYYSLVRHFIFFLHIFLNMAFIFNNGIHIYLQYFLYSKLLHRGHI